jgi:hypothetical protein
MSRRAKPPYDPPREELLIAFAEVMDKWSKVERHMMFLLGAVADITDPSALWDKFHDAFHISKQLRLIEA